LQRTERSQAVSQFFHAPANAKAASLIGMSKSVETIGNCGSEITLAPPRDLADFYLRWPEFRVVAAEIAERETLSATELEVMKWLLRLADRVGPRDLV